MKNRIFLHLLMVFWVVVYAVTNKDFDGIVANVFVAACILSNSAAEYRFKNP